MTDTVREKTVEERRKAARESLDAFARQSTALMDIGAREASVASHAYLEAKKRSLSTDEAAKMMASAVESTKTMRLGAFASEIEPEDQKAFWGDIVAGVVVPATILLLIWIVAAVAHSDIEFRYVAMCAAALLLSAGYLRRVLSRSESTKLVEGALSLFRVNSSVVLNSVGALVVGAVVLVAGGGYLIESRESKNIASSSLLSAEFSRVDAALAMTLAARSTDAEPRQVAELVQRATGLAWTIERSDASGAVLARASLQDRSGSVLVRYVDTPQASERMLQSELEVNGKPVAVGHYLYGVVEAPDVGKPANLREMRLRLEDSAELAVLQLPANTLPPAPGTAILARESEHGVAESIQYVDAVRRSLLVAGKQGMAAPASNK